MPSHRQRAQAASHETQRYFRTIPEETRTDPTSYLFHSPPHLPPLAPENRHELRTCTMAGDPFAMAVDWQRGRQHTCLTFTPVFHGRSNATERICVLNTCSERKPGGDWDGGVLGLGGEESLARRSNLVQCLTSVFPGSAPNSPASRQRNSVYNTSISPANVYPLLPISGIYSPDTVVFRSGHDADYAVWDRRDWSVISVISAAPVKRPKTDETGMHYSFTEEKELQREKMRAILRIAANMGHIDLLLSGFGSCPPGGEYLEGGGSPPSGGFRNPIRDVAEMWRDLLKPRGEFDGWFRNIVFAVGEAPGVPHREFKRLFG